MSAVRKLEPPHLWAALNNAVRSREVSDLRHVIILDKVMVVQAGQKFRYVDLTGVERDESGGYCIAQEKVKYAFAKAGDVVIDPGIYYHRGHYAGLAAYKKTVDKVRQRQLKGHFHRLRKRGFDYVNVYPLHVRSMLALPIDSRLLPFIKAIGPEDHHLEEEGWTYVAGLPYMRGQQPDGQYLNEETPQACDHAKLGDWFCFSWDPREPLMRRNDEFKLEHNVQVPAPYDCHVFDAHFFKERARYIDVIS